MKEGYLPSAYFGFYFVNVLKILAKLGKARRFLSRRADGEPQLRLLSQERALTYLFGCLDGILSVKLLLSRTPYMPLRHTYLFVHPSRAKLTVLYNESAPCQSVRVCLSRNEQLLSIEVGFARWDLVSVGNGAVVNEEVIVPVVFPRRLDLLLKVSHDEHGEIAPHVPRELHAERVAFVLAHKLAVIGREALNVVLVFEGVVIAASVEACRHVGAGCGEVLGIRVYSGYMLGLSLAQSALVALLFVFQVVLKLLSRGVTDALARGGIDYSLKYCHCSAFPARQRAC